MKLTAKIKLQPTPAQADALRRTLAQANAACDHISQVAFASKTFKQYDLHHVTYSIVREQFGLSAQATVRAIAKVADSYKLDRNTLRTFKPTGGIAYDLRLLRYELEGGYVSIWSVDGRLQIPFVCGEHQRAQLATQKGETDLILMGGTFYLCATCQIEEVPALEAVDVLGVDLGIVSIASTSDGQHYAGKHLNNTRRRRRKQRKQIQAVGTKSARRKLKKLSGKERRFATAENHRISKQIVETAKGTNRAIALEELKGIRSRARLRRSQRDNLHSWAFHQLGEFIKYKAKRDGVLVVFIDPRYTSQQCSSCGCIDKRNRPTQNKFSCVSCGFTLNAALTRPLISQLRAGPP